MSEEFDYALEATLVMTDRVVGYLRDNLDRFSKRGLNDKYPHYSALEMVCERYDSGEDLADFFHEIYKEIAPYCGIVLKQNPDAISEIYIVFASYWDKIDRFYSLDEVVDIMERGVHYHPDNLSILVEVVDLYQKKGKEAESLDDKLICVGSALKYIRRINELNKK
jgi:hypothetical protein